VSMTLHTEDRVAIHELIALHGHLIDDGAFDRLGEVSTDDFVYDLYEDQVVSTSTGWRIARRTVIPAHVRFTRTPEGSS
jgi:hypothetical protein